MIRFEAGHGALASSGHPVFPGFNGDGISCQRDYKFHHSPPAWGPTGL